MSSPSHPIWSPLRLTILMIALVVTLWINATEFDATEIKTIITLFVVAASAEGATQFVKGLGK